MANKRSSRKNGKEKDRNDLVPHAPDAPAPKPKKPLGPNPAGNRDNDPDEQVAG